MSNWSHVAAIFRVDSFARNLKFDEIFGAELHWNDPENKWKDAFDHPEKYLPLGSEGSLNISVWEEPDSSCLAAYAVSVFGDLRDHDSIDEIIKWFDEKCKMVFIRQAVITIENELNGVVTKTYEHEDGSE